MLKLWEFYEMFSVMLTTAMFIFYFLNIPVESKPFNPKRGSFYFKKEYKKEEEI